MFDKRKAQAENMHENIVEIKKAIIFVKDYIKKNNLILYGGTAIHLALLAAGQKGLYEPEKLSDYDFYCENPIMESYKLINYLKKEKFKTGVINALHLTTRRVRIGKVAIADLSFFPFIENIPILQYGGLKFVHPLFQCIDIHISLTYIYRNNYWSARMEKDIKRLNMIEEAYPSPVTGYSPKKIYKKNILNLFDTNQVFNNAEKIAEKFMGSYKCLSGDVALALTEKLVCSSNPSIKPLLKETEIRTIEVFENNTTFKEEYGATYYEQILEVIPQSIVRKGVIYYQNYGDLLTANKTKYGWIVNTHYLAATYLFKYFMLGDSEFLDKYQNCKIMIKYGTNPKLPNTINGEYFGTENIHLPWMFTNKSESCALAKIKFSDRPGIFYSKQDKNVENYETYKVRGKQVNKLINKTSQCK